jgi:hypothetical protein
MPRVKVPLPPSTVPPRVGTACAYLSLFVFITKLSRLPRKPEGEPCAHHTIGGYPIDLMMAVFLDSSSKSVASLQASSAASG